MRGSVLAQAGKTEEHSRTSTKRSVSIRILAGLRQSGLIYRRTNRLDQAMADYNRAITRCQLCARLSWRGMVHKAQKEPRQRWKISTRRSAFAPTTPRPIIIAPCSAKRKQHEFAIEDFTSANGLTPQQAEPLLDALSYLALGKAGGATDLDEAVQADPQNGQIWITRGLAYERRRQDQGCRLLCLRDRPAPQG